MAVVAAPGLIVSHQGDGGDIAASHAKQVLCDSPPLDSLTHVSPGQRPTTGQWPSSMEAFGPYILHNGLLESVQIFQRLEMLLKRTE